MYTTFNFKIDTVEGIKEAEKKQAECYKKFNHVEVVPLGINSVQIKCWN